MTASDLEPNPSWDPQVRWRVQYALDRVCFEARDILTRYTDKDHGTYIMPDDIAADGDVTGLLAAGQYQIIDRLQRKLDEARAEMSAVRDEVDGWKRRRYGEAYQPPGQSQKNA